EVKRLVAKSLYIPAYDFVLKASHTFNLLDASGAISVSERASYIASIRELAQMVAQSHLEARKSQNYPLLTKWEKYREAKETPPSTTTYTPIKKEKADFLLEIGSEELPSSFVQVGLSSLEREMKALLQKEGLGFQEIKLYGTPRRLAAL